MSSISALLNPEGAAGRDEQQQQQQPAHPLSPSSSSKEQRLPQTTTYEAADALTALASLGSGQAYAPPRELPSPTAFSSHAPRRTSSIGSYVAPVEPSPPVENHQTHSPTLEQYHHGSKSPEEQRRQSLLLNSSPAHTLAPIQSLSSTLNNHLHDEPPQPTSTAYGTDVSQMVAPPSRGSESGRDDTQNREPGFVRAEPTTSQIREPSEPSEPALNALNALNAMPHPINTNLPRDGSSADADLPSPAPPIKNESSATPREATPATHSSQPERRTSISAADSVDADTLKAIEAVKQTELGLRAKKAAGESVPSPTDTKPTLAPAKKRPAPGTSTAVKKKGTAALKKPPSNKKRKLDTKAEPDADRTRSDTPGSRTSKTPAVKTAKKGSQTNTPLASSPAPDNSSQIHHTDDEGGDSSEDNTLYCICRKPDNHTWMIGCDGGCEDWFHGACVNIPREDEELIDKFICPRCEDKGVQTTYKRMCRREACHKPADIENQSKYCSEECGQLFMEEQLMRTAGANKKKTKKSNKKKKATATAEPEFSSDDNEPPPLGGAIRASDLRDMVFSSKDIQAFRKLGTALVPPILSVPKFAQPTEGLAKPGEDIKLKPSEEMRLNALKQEKDALKSKQETYKMRDKFAGWARDRALAVAKEHTTSKPESFCGYDKRISWSDTEFLVWARTKFGRACFKFETLEPTDEQLAAIDEEMQENPDELRGMSDDDLDVTGLNGRDHLCLKKKGCQKHGNWKTLESHQWRFEQVETFEALKQIEDEAATVIDTARGRTNKEMMERELLGDETKRNADGWVEVVGDA